MSEDRTMPMQQPQWSQHEPDFDEQETVFADHESVTPPTIPLGDQPPAPQQPSGPGFVRTTPAGGTTPAPFSPQDPFAPQPPAAPSADQTMIIAERPTPVFAWLVVVAGPDRGSIGSVLSLRPDTTTIGRAAANHITLRDDTCSAQHARIRIEAQEGAEPAYVLYDMGSSNGTFIGAKETYRDAENQKYRHELQDGDYMLIGETTLVFKKL
jgi:hypothetical protein